MTDHTSNRLGVSFWRRREGGREGGKESVIAHTALFLGEEGGRGGGRERGCVEVVHVGSLCVVGVRRCECV